MDLTRPWENKYGQGHTFSDEPSMATPQGSSQDQAQLVPIHQLSTGLASHFRQELLPPFRQTAQQRAKRAGQPTIGNALPIEHPNEHIKRSLPHGQNRAQGTNVTAEISQTMYRETGRDLDGYDYCLRIDDMGKGKLKHMLTRTNGESFEYKPDGSLEWRDGKGHGAYLPPAHVKQLNPIGWGLYNQQRVANAGIRLGLTTPEDGKSPFARGYIGDVPSDDSSDDLDENGRAGGVPISGW